MDDLKVLKLATDLTASIVKATRLFQGFEYSREFQSELKVILALTDSLDQWLGYSLIKSINFTPKVSEDLEVTYLPYQGLLVLREALFKAIDFQSALVLYLSDKSVHKSSLVTLVAPLAHLETMFDFTNH